MGPNMYPTKNTATGSVDSSLLVTWNALSRLLIAPLGRLELIVVVKLRNRPVITTNNFFLYSWISNGVDESFSHYTPDSILLLMMDACRQRRIWWTATSPKHDEGKEMLKEVFVLCQDIVLARQTEHQCSCIRSGSLMRMENGLQSSTMPRFPA